MSDVDPTVFPDHLVVQKADLREQFATIKEELEALELKVSYIRQVAFKESDEL